MKNIQIAIDGPAASGKGTIADQLANFFLIPVLHTGNIYRAIALRALNKKIDPSNIQQLIKECNDLTLTELDNNDLSNEIVGEFASKISSIKEVRDALYAFQREFIIKNLSCVVEGRDISSIIFPEAKYKFYITADLKVRAQRRHNQQTNFSYEEILEQLTNRDLRDQNRVNAPLKIVTEAIIIDSSNLDVEQTIAKIIDFIKI